MGFVDVFISNNIKKKKNAKKIWRATVYGRYLYYCNMVGVEPVSNYKFYTELESKKFKKTKDGQHYRDIELKPCPF